MKEKLHRKFLCKALLAAVAMALIATGLPANADTCKASAECSSAKQVAETNFKSFLSRVLTEHSRKIHRLDATDTIDNVELGAPIPLNMVVPDKVNTCAGAKCNNTADIGAPIATYFFPVKFNGKIKILMTVDKLPGQNSYEIGSLGYRWLAKQLSYVLQHWSDISFYKSNQAQAYYFAVNGESKGNLTWINPDGTRADEYKTLSTVQGLLPEMKARIDRFLSKGGYQ